MRYGILCKNRDIVSIDKFGYTVVDLGIAVVGTTCKHDTALMIFFHPFKDFFALLLHILMSRIELFPCSVNGIRYLGRIDFREFFDKGLRNQRRIREVHEGVPEDHIAVSDGFNIVLDILGV